MSWVYRYNSRDPHTGAYPDTNTDPTPQPQHAYAGDGGFVWGCCLLMHD